LGDAPWNSLRNTPEKIDRIAEVLVFREDIERIREGLREIGLDPPVLDKLMEATEAGAFDDFRGAAHISAKAARNIVPGLLEGLVYSEACARVGYDHSTRAAVALKDINGPVTRRAFGEAIKQIRTVAREHGPIDTVHIELARDVGKSAEERAELTKGIEDRNVEKEKRKTRAGELIGRRINDIELLRYEFVEEQHYKCIYCDGAIAPDGFVDNDTRYQVDHILPWSRFGDDSFTNKTLCCTRCNQEKRGRTPFEWFSAEKTDDDWERFVACFESLKEMKGFKKRNFKLKDAAAVEEKFKARNLTDTRWAARLLADELKRMFPAPEGKRRIFTRPGAITSKLRRAWGFEGMKKIDGKRVSDDRHHAVDAIVLALTTESLLNRMTVEIQRRETEGRQDDIFHVQPPWDHFHREVVEKVYGENGLGGVFVSRAERRRARGKAHDATVKQIREIDGNEVVFERKAIEKLSLNDLDKIPVPQPYGSIKDPAKLRDELVAALRSWIGEGKPKGQERLPRSPKGDIIRKVRAATNAKVGLRLNGGTVDRGEMARVDVFRKADKNGKYQYFLVPIYPHEIATMVEPPTRAAKAGEEENWPIIDSSFEFLWSLNQRCWLGLTKISGEIIEGYFAGLDRATASITVFADNDPSKITRSIGVKTLTSFDKYAVDRLGRRTPIASEVRTWHGVACT
jgi:CRISPR-associated endonuclease Csn1